MNRKKVYYKIKGEERWYERIDNIFYRFKEVRLRKDDRCIICGKIINKGEIALVNEYTERSSSWASSWVRFTYCSECYEKKEEENETADAYDKGL